MKKYFYSDGADSFGPFTIEELKEKGITRETDVWFEGLPDWTQAANVPELTVLFGSVAPPVIHKIDTQKEGSAGNQVPPKTWLVESILVTLFCCFPFGIAGIVNAGRVESRFHSGDIEGAKRSSKEAKKWTTIGFWSSLALWVIWLFFLFVASVVDGL